MAVDQIVQVATIAGVAVPLTALAWSAVTYVQVKKAEIRREQYERFFEVMEHLGKHDSSVASKMAAAYELRKFSEYTEVIARLASKVRYDGESAEMLKEEVELTAAFLTSLAAKRQP